MEQRHVHHNEAERRRWQDPEAILAGIGLGAGDVFADIGCGRGFFALPAARITGKSGHVYGIDNDGEALNDLRLNADVEELGNVTLIPGAAEETVACRQCADFVFFGIDLHDFYDAPRVLENAMKMIKPSGLLVDLDWKKEPLDIGPPIERKFSVEQATGLIEGAGFVVIGVREPGPMHYMIEARPAGGSGRARDNGA